MRLQLPQFVFRKKHDNYYLFTEFDIIRNEQFYEKLIAFIGQIGGTTLIVEIDDNLSEKGLLQNFEYLNPTVDDLRNLYDMDIVSNGGTVPFYYLNHYIRDENNKWEIYVSLENELSIFGCDQSVISVFLNCFLPYKEEALVVKRKIIGDMFRDETSRKIYLDTLDENYNFSKAKML